MPTLTGPACATLIGAQGCGRTFDVDGLTGCCDLSVDAANPNNNPGALFRVRPCPLAGPHRLIDT
jgi:hypothetical protein